NFPKIGPKEGIDVCEPMSFQSNRGTKNVGPYALDSGGHSPARNSDSPQAIEPTAARRKDDLTAIRSPSQSAIDIAIVEGQAPGSTAVWGDHIKVIDQAGTPRAQERD